MGRWQLTADRRPAGAFHALGWDALRGGDTEDRKASSRAALSVEGGTGAARSVLDDPRRTARTRSSNGLVAGPAELVACGTQMSSYRGSEASETGPL